MSDIKENVSWQVLTIQNMELSEYLKSENGYRVSLWCPTTINSKGTKNPFPYVGHYSLLSKGFVFSKYCAWFIFKSSFKKFLRETYT